MIRERRPERVDAVFGTGNQRCECARDQVFSLHPVLPSRVGLRASAPFGKHPATAVGNVPFSTAATVVFGTPLTLVRFLSDCKQLAGAGALNARRLLYLHLRSVLLRAID